MSHSQTRYQFGRMFDGLKKRKTWYNKKIVKQPCKSNFIFVSLLYLFWQLSIQISGTEVREALFSQNTSLLLRLIPRILTDSTIPNDSNENEAVQEKQLSHKHVCTRRERGQIGASSLDQHNPVNFSGWIIEWTVNFMNPWHVRSRIQCS